jgi:aryl-alcohol dehydrogenase-like predicted oxidoreductase
MQLRKLGNSELNITPIGIGTAAMGGGGWEFGFGPQNDANSISAIHASLDCGINWIDTAALYGLGHSEEIVGRALKGHAQRPFVFSKCGVVWDAQGKTGNSLKAASIRKDLEDSLRRLKTDVIDLYQIHWPEPDEDIEEGWAEMARIRREGKIRYIGVSNFSVRQMQRAQRIASITSLQPPYSILSRQVEAGILPFAQQNNIGVIADRKSVV